MQTKVNKELMEELEKVPEGMRFIEAPNFLKIKQLLEEGTPYIAVSSTPYVRPDLYAKIAEGVKRSCNRHSDCDQANKDWLLNHHMEKYVPIHFHCHDDECEDCFGY